MVNPIPPSDTMKTSALQGDVPPMQTASTSPFASFFPGVPEKELKELLNVFLNDMCQKIHQDQEKLRKALKELKED